MAAFQNTVTIRRAIDDVFAFLADFENVPTWNFPNRTADMTRDEGIHLPVGKRLPSQESLLKYDADAVAMGPEQIAGGVTVASA